MAYLEKHGSVATHSHGVRTLHHHCHCHKTEEVKEVEVKPIVEIKPAVPEPVHMEIPKPAPVVISVEEKKPVKCWACGIKKWFKRFF